MVASTKSLMISLLCLVLTGPADAAPSSIFATSSIRPWGYVNDQGVMDGVLVEFIDALHKGAEVSYENSIQPYTRVIHSLKAGRINFAVLIDSPAMGPKVIKVDHLLVADVVLVGGKNREKIHSLDALSGERVGYIRGSKYGRAFDRAENFSKYPVNSMNQGLAMLLAGHLDALASLDHTLYFTMAEMSIEPNELCFMMKLGEVSASLYMSAHSPRDKIFQLYVNEIANMRKEGQLDLFFKLPKMDFTSSQISPRAQ